MKSYKNKRVRSRRNKSRRYSRKRKGGDTKIIIGRTMGYRLFGKSNCKQLETNVRKEVENLNNKCNKIELSKNAEQQLNQCPEEEGAYFSKDAIQTLIDNHNNQVSETCVLGETTSLEGNQTLMNTSPSKGGKRRRHHRKSRKHSRRH